MDGREEIKNRSLQKDIFQWLFIISVLFMILSSLVIGLVTFFEAREHQDKLLVEISKLSAAQITAFSRESQRLFKNKENVEEESILVQVLESSKESTLLHFPKPIEKGFSIQKAVDDDRKWRIFKTEDANGRAYIVAQQTEASDEFAINSTLGVAVPIMVIFILLLIGIHYVLKLHFAPLNELASKLKMSEPYRLKKISKERVSQEILPFVDSINLFLKRSSDYIEKRNRFISDAAHELRTPIAGLILASENLEKSTSNEERIEWQRLISIRLEGLKKLVAQLLDLARLQGQEKESYDSIDFLKIIREVVEERYLLLEQRNLTIEVDCNQTVIIRDLHGHLKQLVSNAIENAIRHSFKGSLICISLRKELGEVIFSVKNQAPKIDEQEIERIWEPFYRPSNKRNEGTGLGLSICLEVAHKLGGVVSLKNLEKEGRVEFCYIQPLSS